MEKQFVNASYITDDMSAWRAYKQNPTPQNRSMLLSRFSGLINNHVNKWSGPAVSRDVLVNQARILAVKAFDKYDPNAGATLATYLTHQLMPLSRTVYNNQNTFRLPEYLTQKISTFNRANEALSVSLGREPTTLELHNELGWPASEITKLRDRRKTEFIESGPAVPNNFFEESQDDLDAMALSGIYFELLPDEKTFFEHLTGYNGAKKLSNTELTQKYNCTLSQIMYKKRLLRKHIEKIMKTKMRGYKW